MSWFKYPIKVKCNNCGNECIIKIPKGITIKDYLGEKRAKCSYCKCDTIENYYFVRNKK